MKKEIIGIIVCMLLISAGFLPITATLGIKKTLKPIIRDEKTLYVGGNGAGNYSKIQDAINDASDGDTVFVYDDSSPYNENIHVGKSINLIGENRYTTQINGSGGDGTSVVVITADNVSVSSFDIENSGVGTATVDSGILAYSDNLNIVNNLITYNHIGICLWSSRGITISNNIIIRNNKRVGHANGIGINIPGFFGSKNCNISHNLISTNGNNIDLAYTSNNIIYKNEIINATKHGGIWAQFCNDNTIFQNNISNNCGRGIDIYNGSYNNISYNRFNGNGWGTVNGTVGADGIHIQVNSKYNIVRGNLVKKNKFDGIAIYREDTNYNLIIENDIVDNDRYGMEIITFYPGSVMNNLIYHNNFVNNTDVNAIDLGVNIWDNGYPSGGNYWDDYTGVDNDNDGIGDMPYNIPDGENKDYFPLIYRWGNNSPLADFTYVRCNFSVTFNAKSSFDRDGTVVNCNWDFGDGTSGSGMMITHVYSNSGEYNVTLTVTDDDGKTDDVSKTIDVPYDNIPPDVPSDPYPYDGQTGVDVDINLSWNCNDLDGDPLTYFVYFEANDSTPDVLVSENQSNTFYHPGILNLSTTYYWQIVAWDLCSESASPIWNFITRDNSPPYTPHNPDPPNGATDIDINSDFSWKCSDPDGDDLTYDVYFEAEDPTPDVLVSNNQSENWYDPGKMEYNTHYYWQIVAWDNFGESKSGPVWDFTTSPIPNDPPYPPSDPDPENGSTNIDIDADLSWTGGDPDKNDTVVYDVYLEANDPTPDILVADDINETTFDPGTLDCSTTYYWQVIAKDNHFASTPSPIWHFTISISDLDCDGSLSWTRVNPGSTVSGKFTVSNIGESLSLLDWEISDWPSWGSNWAFTPVSGDDLKPGDGPVTVNVTMVAPDEKNQEFTGEVEIVNKENTSDNCTIPVYLKTPKTKPFNFNFNLLSRLFERFPIISRFLSLIKYCFWAPQ